LHNDNERKRVKKRERERERKREKARRGKIKWQKRARCLRKNDKTVRQQNIEPETNSKCSSKKFEKINFVKQKVKLDSERQIKSQNDGKGEQTDRQLN
jgi:hypothetical protein